MGGIASQSATCARRGADDRGKSGRGKKKKKRSEDEGSERQLFTDKQADTWLQSAGRWEEAKSTVSSRDGAACHSPSRATRTPGSRELQFILSH